MQTKIVKNLNQKGIWQYGSYLPEVPPEFRLSLNEGNTLEYEIEQGVFLKREDENPTGSLKDRGMAYLISKTSSLGYKQFVLSSSGNAAISATKYCQLANLKLKVFVSVNVDKEKLKTLENLGVDLSIDQRPLTMAARFAKDNHYYNLRPSINEFGTTGYQTIAFELLQDDNFPEDIFIPVSSGVNFLGIYLGFKKFGQVPRLHLCQSSFVSSLANLYDKNYNEETNSLATALVARHSPLKSEIIEAVKDSKGTGWVVENKHISQANEILTKKGISTSFEGALVYGAYLKAVRQNLPFGRTFCLLTGKKYAKSTD